MLNKINFFLISLKATINHPLNRKKRVRAMFTFLFWQIRLRVLKQKRIFAWLFDAKFYYDLFDFGVLGNLWSGLDEFESMSFLINVMREDDLLIDIGSNSGIYTILSSKVIGSKTFAYEPNKKCFKKLTKNVSLNSIQEKVTAKRIAISHSSGERYFSKNLDTLGRFSDKEEGIESEVVQVSSLDEESKSFPDKNLFIKIDVEGFETEVILGAENLLSKQNCICLIIELCGNGENFGFSEKKLYRDIIKKGFVPINYDPFERALKKNESFDFNGNQIFIKNEDVILKRLLEMNSKYYIENLFT